MKKAILVLVVLLGISTRYSQAKTDESKTESTLTMVGETVTNDSYTYEVFLWKNDEYHSISLSSASRGKYRIKVDAKHDYMVVFLNSEGSCKTMFITKAISTGHNYKYQLDIDFRFTTYFAEVKRRGSNYRHAVYDETLLYTY